MYLNTTKSLWIWKISCEIVRSVVIVISGFSVTCIIMRMSNQMNIYDVIPNWKLYLVLFHSGHGITHQDGILYNLYSIDRYKLQNLIQGSTVRMFQNAFSIIYKLNYGIENRNNFFVWAFYHFEKSGPIPWEFDLTPTCVGVLLQKF